jgi:hypothetical protein
MQVSEELTEAFRAAQSGSTRYLVVRIKDEELNLESTSDASDSEAADFGTILSNVSEHDPSFVLFRRDSSNAAAAEASNSRNWHLVSYVPDTSKVRQKMLYASSKKDLLLKLGASLFADADFYVSDPEDLTYDSFLHSTREATDAERKSLLTEAEAIHAVSFVSFCCCGRGRRCRRGRACSVVLLGVCLCCLLESLSSKCCCCRRCCCCFCCCCCDCCSCVCRSASADNGTPVF